MRLAVVHSFYRASRPSGENAVVRAELAALRRAGIEAELFAVATPEHPGPSQVLRAAARVATGHGRHPLAALREFRPDLVHLHNLFPGFGRRWTARLDRYLVSVHNYRFACAEGTLQRAGAECRLCLDGSALHGLRHGCYQRSRAATAPVTLGLLRPDPVLEGAGLVLVPSDRLARDLVAARPTCRDRTVVHPPFLPDALAPPAPPAAGGRGSWLFAGRLSAEKGLYELLCHWPAGEPLTVAGDGPERGRCAALARGRRLAVEFTGPLPRTEVVRAMARSTGLVVPSRAPETFGLIYLEALAAGCPVVARRGTTPAALAEAEGTGCAYTGGTGLPGALERVRAGEFAPGRLREVFTARYSEASFVERARAVHARAMEVIR